jgi:phosphate uptake regulator
MKIIERKLQELGKSLFVSLPKEWIKTYKLKKGSKIKMVSSDQGLLTIAPEFRIREGVKESKIEFDEHFQRKFFHEYFEGNEKLTINLNKKISEIQRKKFYNFLKRFITIQIIEESESKIVLKSFKIEELSIEECMKRLYFLSLGMLDELLSTNNKTMLEEMRDNMTRFYYLLVMQIRRFLDEGKFTKENQIPLVRAMDFRMAAEKVQRVGEIAHNFGNIKDNDVSPFLKKVYDHYSKSVLSFINSNYSKAPELWDLGNQLKNSHKRFLTKKYDGQTHQQIRDVHQILRYSNEIAGLIR